MIKKIIREMKKHKKGIAAGSIMGAVIVLYMKSKGAITMAMEPGLIDQILPSIPTIDATFIKLLLVAIILGGTIGYIIESAVIKK